MARDKGNRKAREILKAEVSDVRQIATILKTVTLASEQKGTVKLQDDGLTFTVEVGATILARAHLHYKNNFLTYAYNPPARQPRQNAGKGKQKATKKSTRRAERDSSATEPEDNDEDVQVIEDNDEEDEDEMTHSNANEEDSEPINMEFEISLSALLNCINIFGESTVKPVSAKQAAAREKWKNRNGRNGGDDGGGGRGGGYGNRGDDDEEGEMDREERGHSRGGSTVNLGKKKGSTAMVLSWEAEGCPLVLLLEENGMVTRCEITTFAASEICDLPYDDDERVQKLILNSSWLSEAISEIDSSCDRLTLRFTPPKLADNRNGNNNARNKGKNRQADGTGSNDDEEEEDQDDGGAKAAFSLEGKSNTGSVQMDYPFTRDVLEVCECDRPMRNSYKFAHLAYIRQALTYSTKASLRTDSSGVLSMQFMIVNVAGKDDGSGGFVEFTCMPLNEEDE